MSRNAIIIAMWFAGEMMVISLRENASIVPLAILITTALCIVTLLISE